MLVVGPRPDVDGDLVRADTYRGQVTERSIGLLDNDPRTAPARRPVVRRSEFTDARGRAATRGWSPVGSAAPR